MEKKYLNFGKILAYGSGDMASNFCYSFVSAFTLIYLTDTVGLNAGIIGTLMLFSRIFDGVSDVLAGNIIDKTHHRWGKARAWMIWTIVPVALTQALMFSIPNTDQIFQYAYFFVTYTLLNAVFYTLNNVAYATLSVFITPNKQERVNLGVSRFIFTCIAGLLVSSGTTALVNTFGGGMAGWRMTAIIFSLGFAVISLICALVCKELPESELAVGNVGEVPVENEKIGLIKTIIYLLKNKYYIYQLLINIFYNFLVTVTSAVGIYYMTYILGNESLLGIFSLVQMIPMIIGLSLTPMLDKKMGIYKTNVSGFVVTVVASVPFLFFGIKGAAIPMMICHAIAWLGRGPYSGNVQALTAEISAYTLRKDRAHVEGAMFSCSSMGVKVGAGVGNVVAGWLLEASHYNGTATVQPQSALNMITFMYAAIPLIFSIFTLILLSLQNVEKANKDWDEKMATKA